MSTEKIKHVARFMEEAVDRVLGHTTGKTTRTYNRYSYYSSGRGIFQWARQRQTDGDICSCCLNPESPGLIRGECVKIRKKRDYAGVGGMR